MNWYSLFNENGKIISKGHRMVYRHIFQHARKKGADGILIVKLGWSGDMVVNRRGYIKTECKGNRSYWYKELSKSSKF